MSRALASSYSVMPVSSITCSTAWPSWATARRTWFSPPLERDVKADHLAIPVDGEGIGACQVLGGVVDYGRAGVMLLDTKVPR
jgi:hypothetical protein